jgi:hypothetical protein
MRCGCIAVGIIKCDICDRNIEHGERYLFIDSEKEDKQQRICLNCCVKKKYAKNIVEKGEKMLSLIVD